MKKKLHFKSSLTLVAGLVFAGVNAQVTTINYSGAIVDYTVPAGINFIQIDALGAAGGDGQSTNSGVGGHGARMVGTFHVVPGQVLKVLVGEEGTGSNYVGGGGGGTFVWSYGTGTLLIAAGGGGGGGATDIGNTYIDGLDATTTELGTNGNGLSDGAGLTSEGGTAPSTATYASGGAGWNSNGANGTIHGCTFNSTGGQSPANGGAGGIGGGSPTFDPSNGGFGGGGGGNARCGAVGGGGGGGYSGGGAGGEVIDGEYNGGGGAGSFNGGTNQTNTAGAGTGDGQVVITPITSMAGIDAAALQIGVYPNPTSELVTVTYPGEFDYKLIGINGQVIMTGSGVNSEIVSLSNQAQGSYFLQVTTAQKTEIITVVKL